MRKYFLPLTAVALLVFATNHVFYAQQVPPPPPPPSPPARTPFGHTVAGAGIVEAQTENIAIGSHLGGVVAEVFVRVGQWVPAGTPLFRLDDRHLKADLGVREANLATAKAQLKRQEDLPRSEELPVSAARVREAQASLISQEDMLRRMRALYARRAVSEEELIQRQQACRVAREQLTRAQAEHDLLRAGAWEADKAVARAAVTQAEAAVTQTRTELDRLLVRTPIDGEILQVNVRPGEAVGILPGQALVVVGNVRQLHVRTDIDEHDIPRFQPRASARAALRGDPTHQYPLEFVRVEPYVVPKRSLTGAGTERVDTRVLQVIYALDQSEKPVYVGQQLDVFIEAPPGGPEVAQSPDGPPGG